MVSNWYQQINSYIDSNLEDFIRHFFKQSTMQKIAGGYRVNPAPCCGHNDCFSFAENMNAGNCFSCGDSGNRIHFLNRTIGEQRAIDELQKWSGIVRNDEELTPEDTQKMMAERQIKEIVEFAVDFYNNQLLHSENKITKGALGQQVSPDLTTGGRSHTKYSLQDYRVGFSLDNFGVLEKQLSDKGYSDDIIKEARSKFWVPPFCFTYPYYDRNGNIVRINAKAFKRTCMGSRNEDGTYNKDCAAQFFTAQEKEIREHTEQTGHKMSNVIYSTGEKRDSFFYLKNEHTAPYLILVEGENDAISVHEEMVAIDPEYQKNYDIKAIGGRMAKGAFRSQSIRKYKRVYGIFDNDDAGKNYMHTLNEEAADTNVYEVVYDNDYNDIDNYLKAYDVSERETIFDLLGSAIVLDTKGVIIHKQDGPNSTGKTWLAKNRSFQIKFSIDEYNRKQNQLMGTLEITVNDKLVAKNSGGLDKMRVEAVYNSAKLELSQHLSRYYNYVPWDSDKPSRDFKELADIVMFTKSYEIVVKQLAWYLHNTEENLYNEKYKYLQRVINDEVTIAEVLKEVNGFTNSEFDTSTIPLKITLSQFFHITNDDAYYFFNRLVQDGSSVKLVPCLLSNKGEEIRLDLIKQKDPKSLLLIENKYELPYEVEASPMNPEEVSLQSVWIDKWKAGEIPKEDLDPANLIQEIEEFITRFLYLKKDTRKVLALWIYATYYYMLFKSGFPYIMFNGPKGTGKTQADMIIYLLGCNSKMGLDFSTSSLYRMINYEGGTFILDEVEHLSDKRSADVSDYAKILKGGYSDSSYIYRTNMDKGGITERFSAFGPKVISNINGIDDVIADRCIFVRTFRVPTELLEGIEDINRYKTELRHIPYSITSRCALSALENFQKVHNIFESPESSFETDNARLNQIVKPLFTIAELVGGNYRQHLLSYYQQEIEQTKKEVADQTLEGMLGNLLKRAANELKGIEKDKWVTDHAIHQYTKPIQYDHITGIMILDSMHFKMLVEEMAQGKPVDLKLLHSTLRNVLGPNFDYKNSRKQTTITINDEGLQRRMNDNRTIRGYLYTIRIDDWADDTSGTIRVPTDESDDELF